jgi:glycine cleavage system pyridoxal-binding protein P
MMPCMGCFKIKCIKSLEYTQNLYILEDIDLDAVDSLIQNIPHNIKLRYVEAQRQIEAPTSTSVLVSLEHVSFEIYKYLVNRFTAFVGFLTTILSEALDSKYPTS